MSRHPEYDDNTKERLVQSFHEQYEWASKFIEDHNNLIENKLAYVEFVRIYAPGVSKISSQPNSNAQEPGVNQLTDPNNSTSNAPGINKLTEDPKATYRVPSDSRADILVRFYII